MLTKKLYYPLLFVQRSLPDIYTNFIEVFPLIQNPRIISFEEINVFLEYFYRMSMFIYENKLNNIIKQLKYHDEIKAIQISQIPAVKCWKQFLTANEKSKQPPKQTTANGSGGCFTSCDGTKIEPILQNEQLNVLILQILKELEEVSKSPSRADGPAVLREHDLLGSTGHAQQQQGPQQ